MPAAEVSSTQRRRLRAVLRQLRAEAALTQEQVATAMDWSLSKVIRVETGVVSVSVNDVRALLNLYGVLDKDRADEIVELARVARQKPWWYAYRDSYSPGYVSYLDLEAGAAVLKFFQPAIVPGLLQTEDYARAAVAATAFGDEQPEQADIDVQVRQQRQHAVFDRPNPPRLEVLIEEHALRRPVGGPAVMRRQLDRLLDVQELPHVEVRVQPLARADVVGGMYGQFIILEFEDEDDPPAVYLEGLTGSDVLRAETRLTGRYSRMFDRLVDATLDKAASTAFLRALAHELG